MANPQKENGHIRIANTIWDALCRIRISGEARQVMDVVIRQTWGFNKKSDMITLDKFALMTGLRKADVIRAVKKLYQMNLISKNANGKYYFQKDFDEWKPLAKKQTISNNANLISNIANNPLAIKQISTVEPITITSKTTINNNNIMLSQIENLLTNISDNDIKYLIDEYMENLRNENKTKTLSNNRKARELNQLYNLYKSYKNKDIFKQALLISCSNCVPNINYVKKVMKSKSLHPTMMPPNCGNVSEYKTWKNGKLNHESN